MPEGALASQEMPYSSRPRLNVARPREGRVVTEALSAQVLAGVGAKNILLSEGKAQGVDVKLEIAQSEGCLGISLLRAAQRLLPVGF